jgi:UDP-glucose 4-epimerase
VLDTIRKNQPACKYLHISSAAVYGNPLRLPVQETDIVAPVSPYGFHKWMSEIVCTEYFKLYDLRIAVMRPFSLYGNGLRKQLLWDLSNKLSKSDKTELYGTGNETRDFINITDLCTVVDLIAVHGRFENESYNVANGIQTSIRQIADLFEASFPGKKSISFTGERNTHDPLQWHADNSKIKQLGFSPAVKLENGVQDYIQWYLESKHDK